MKFSAMDNLESDIKENIHKPVRRGGRSRIWFPLALVCIGGILFLRAFGVPLPEWIFDWPVLIIALGIFSGLTHAFRGPGWLIMILIGTFFLMDHLIPGIDIHRFIWPAAIIAVGLVMLVRPKKVYW